MQHGGLKKSQSEVAPNGIKTKAKIEICYAPDALSHNAKFMHQ